MAVFLCALPLVPALTLAAVWTMPASAGMRAAVAPAPHPAPAASPTIMVVPLVVELLVFGLGVYSILKPLWFTRMQPGGYSQEYLARPMTKIMSRVVGYMFTQFGLLTPFPLLVRLAFPSVDEAALYQRQFSLLFAMVVILIICNVVSALLRRIPATRTWMDQADLTAAFTDRRQVAPLLCAIPVIPLVALASVVLR